MHGESACEKYSHKFLRLLNLEMDNKIERLLRAVGRLSNVLNYLKGNLGICPLTVTGISTQALKSVETDINYEFTIPDWTEAEIMHFLPTKMKRKTHL